MDRGRTGWTAALTCLATAWFAAGAGAVPGGPAAAHAGGAVEAAPGGAAGRGAMQAAGAEEAGARLERKLADIVRRAEEPSPEPRSTRLLESEINGYLAFQGVPFLPAGIRAPAVRIGAGRLAAEAVIDLDAIRESRERRGFDLLRYLAGELVVTARGRVRAAGGLARVEVEAVTVAGVPVPVPALQELVRHFTRTPERPAGTRLDEPIPLPFGITEIRLAPGLAVVVQ